MMARPLLEWLIVALALVVTGCGKSPVAPSADPPGTRISAITDGAGRAVQVAAAPQRIISVSPAATDILMAENAHSQIVGATRFCVIPAEDEGRITRIGGVVDPDYERIMALKPDLVIIPWLADKTLQEKLLSLGLPVIVLHPESLQGVIDDIRLLGQATGHAAIGASLAKNLEGIRALAARRWQGVPPENRPRVLVYMGDISPAPGSYVDDLLTAAGGRNALPRGAKTWVHVTPESALQLAPDIVVEIFPPEQSDVPVARPIPPKSARLVTLSDGAAFYHPASDLGRALWMLAQAIDAKRFPEAQPPVSSS